MSIKQWPIKIQPREKLLAHGPASLTDAELLAIFIQTGNKGESALTIAYRLLSEFGDLKSLLDQPFANFDKINGLGKAKFVMMQAALELSQRYLQQKITTSTQPYLHSSNSVKQFLSLYFRQLQQEIVVCIFLTQLHELITVETLFRGSINHAPIFPREIVARTLHHKSPAIILAHNHPSGDCKPSSFDIEITQQLRQQLAFLDITLLDHCIVAESTIYSLAEHSWT